MSGSRDFMFTNENIYHKISTFIQALSIQSVILYGIIDRIEL